MLRGMAPNTLSPQGLIAPDMGIGKLTRGFCQYPHTEEDDSDGERQEREEYDHLYTVCIKV